MQTSIVQPIYIYIYMLAMKLEDIERENFDGSLAKHQIHQYFPPSINCAIRYAHTRNLFSS